MRAIDFGMVLGIALPAIALLAASPTFAQTPTAPTVQTPTAPVAPKPVAVKPVVVLEPLTSEQIARLTALSTELEIQVLSVVAKYRPAAQAAQAKFPPVPGETIAGKKARHAKILADPKLVAARKELESLLDGARKRIEPMLLPGQKARFAARMQIRRKQLSTLFLP